MHARTGFARLAQRRRARTAAAAALAAGVTLVHLWLLGASAPVQGLATTAVAVSRTQPGVQLRSVPPPREPLAAPDAIPAPARAPQPPSPRVAAVRAATPTAAKTTVAAPDLPLPATARPADDADAATPLTRDAVGAPAPIYPTRMPPPARLRYEIVRGSGAGSGVLEWRPDGAAYELEWGAAMPGNRRVEQRSQGSIDAAGVAPVRLTDRRRGRGIQAATFERARGRITFSGPRWEYPLLPGVQDRLSWIVQLSAIAAAGGVQAGSEVTLQVVGARGAFAHWRFMVDGVQTLAGPAGEVRAVRLVREPAHPYDLRLEVWLAPALGWWPVRLRQSQIPGDESTEWRLLEEPAAPAAS